MRAHNRLWACLGLVLFLVSALPSQAVIDQGTLDAVDISNIEFVQGSRSPSIVVGDGTVSEVWNQVTFYPVPSYGPGGGIQAVYGEDHVYFLLTYDSSIIWVAMQWDSDFTGVDAIPMELNDDMWVMGQTEFTTIVGDGSSAGQGESPYIINDDQNDLLFEIVGGEELNYVELKRQLVTGDTAGKDVQFEPETEYSLFYASNLYHGIDSDITKHTFRLSDTQLGDAVEITTPLPILNDVFLVTYLNASLLGMVAVLAVLVLPLSWRRSS